MSIRGFVLTGSKKQYNLFCSLNKINRKEFPLLTSVKQLSKENGLVLKFGTFFQSPLYKDVLKFEDKLYKGDD